MGGGVARDNVVTSRAGAHILQISAQKMLMHDISFMSLDHNSSF